VPKLMLDETLLRLSFRTVLN